MLLRTEQECGEHVVSEPVEHCHGGHGHEVSFAIIGGHGHAVAHSFGVTLPSNISGL